MSEIISSHHNEADDSINLDDVYVISELTKVTRIADKTFRNYIADEENPLDVKKVEDAVRGSTYFFTEANVMEAIARYNRNDRISRRSFDKVIIELRKLKADKNYKPSEDIYLDKSNSEPKKESQPEPIRESREEVAASNMVAVEIEEPFKYFDQDNNEEKTGYTKRIIDVPDKYGLLIQNLTQELRFERRRAEKVASLLGQYKQQTLSLTGEKQALLESGEELSKAKDELEGKIKELINENGRVEEFKQKYIDEKRKAKFFRLMAEYEALPFYKKWKAVEPKMEDIKIDEDNDVKIEED